MNSAAPGTFAIGGDLTVDRIGFGAMRLARNGMGDTVTRDPETARAVLRRAAAAQIAFVPFGPLGSGRGSGRDENYAAVARRHGATIAQVALAHVLALSPSMLAIPGTGSLAHLEENIAARSLALTPDDITALR
jgi:aryl-alcohol dehydrogenase-like predicted oxidoreductase